MQKHAVKNPSIILDTSHDNSRVNGVKHEENQARVIREVMALFKKRPELMKTVKGFMFESFIKAGAQKVDLSAPERLDKEGLSITDPCLNFEQTENLLFELAEFKDKVKV